MTDLPTTFISETQLRATLDPSTHAIGVEPLTVANSIGVSNAVDFTFTDAPVGATLTSLYPPKWALNAAAAESGTTIPITGTNLRTGDIVYEDGVAVATSPDYYEPATKIWFTPTDNVLGVKNVEVRSTDGAVSNVLTYEVVTPLPRPTITSMTPSPGEAGVRQVVTVLGTGFVPEGIAEIEDSNGEVLSEPSTYVSPTEITVPVTPAAGVYSLEIIMPGAEPNWQTRAWAAVEAVTAPTLTSITPNAITIPVGADVPLTIIGTGFPSSGLLTLHCITRFTHIPVTYVSDTEVSVPTFNADSYELGEHGHAVAVNGTVFSNYLPITVT